MNDETNEIYHSDKTHVSASMLKDLDESPRIFQAKHILGTMRQEPTTSMELGTAVHCLALEPQRYDTQYVIQPTECNDRRTKAFKEWSSGVHPSMMILKQETAETVRCCVEALHSIPLVHTLLEANGDTEKSVRWTCPTSGVPCKLRADKIVHCADTVLDIKTMQSCSEDEFSSAVAKYRYHLQAAHYLSGIEWLHERFSEWLFIFACVETSPPFRARVFQLDSEALAFGMERRDLLLVEYASRSVSGDWSEDNEHELTEVSLPRWFLRKV